MRDNEEVVATGALYVAQLPACMIEKCICARSRGGFGKWSLLTRSRYAMSSKIWPNEVIRLRNTSSRVNLSLIEMN